MRKTMVDYLKPVQKAAGGFLLCILFSCSDNNDIPFPEEQLSLPQPVSQKLVFTKPRPLTWDTIKKGGITVVKRKFDIDALPSVRYDTTGFKPFIRPPQETTFNFKTLPEKSFDFEKIPSVPLEFKTSVLPIPSAVKIITPSDPKGRPLSIIGFNQANGLPAKEITGLVKTQDGLLWITSQEGIFRFNGQVLETIIPGPFNDFVSGIGEDKFGRIWFKTETQIGMIDPIINTVSYTPKIKGFSLSKIARTKDGFLCFTNWADSSICLINPGDLTFKSIGFKDGINSRTLLQVYVDHEDNLWVTTRDKGLNIIDYKRGKIKFLSKLNGLANDSLFAINGGKEGQVWVSADGKGLNVIDPGKGTIKLYSQDQQVEPRFYITIEADSEGQLWLGSGFGIFVINTINQQTRFVFQDDGLFGSTILSMLPEYNRVWVGSRNGLNIVAQNAHTAYPMQVSQLISVLTEKDGTIWAATDDGIRIIQPKKNKVSIFKKEHGLADNIVQAFAKVDNKICVATDGGFDIIDPVNKTLEHTGKAEGLVNDSLYATFFDKAGNIFVTGPTNGINLVDASRKMIRHASENTGLGDNLIQDIRQDNEGNLWFATSKKGIDVIDMRTGTIRSLVNQPGLSDTCNKMLLKDASGRIWIGTDKGIYIADISRSTLTPISMREGLPENKILSLLEYNGAVVAGTTNHLSVIVAPAEISLQKSADQKNKWKITLATPASGLARIQTTSWSTDGISADGSFLWGDKGLTVIHSLKPDTNKTTTYITGVSVMTQPHKFISKTPVYQADSLQDKDHTIAYEKRPVNAGYFARPGLKWTSVEGPYNLPADLEIPHDNNYLQFQFTQSNLYKMDTTWYTYVLEGVDKNWSALSSNPYSDNYLNLQPGKYTFKVRSRNAMGAFSEPAVFSFNILPPWYKTWWAYTLMFVLAAGSLRAYILYRSSVLQKENKKLEEKINRRTLELQKSLEDLKATQSQLIQSEKMASLGELTAGIAHEIQNPLNFVNNFSEVNRELISELKENLEQGNLQDAKSIANDIEVNEFKINHHGRRADSIVKGMLQHSRNSNGVKEPTDINALADEYFRLAYHGLRAQNKSFTAKMQHDFDESLRPVNIVPQDIGRVILNLITNAFHAVTEKLKDHKNGYEPTVTLSTKQINGGSYGSLGYGRVEIRVADNGKGIPKKVIDKIFQPFFTTKPAGEGTGLGLSLSYDIVKAHGGEIKVETMEGEGTTFILGLPVQ